MQRNTMKEKLLAGQPVFGTASSIRSATTAGVLASAGSDYVLIDNQHGEWDDLTRLEAIRAVYLQNVTPITRVRINEFGVIGRALDSGALGIVVPMVNTASEASAAAFAMRYPPRGGRSAGDNMSINLWPDYRSWANDELFLAIQIETAQGLAHVDAIMAVDGVDGCWIGPADLALSLGVQQGSPAHTEAIRSVLQACRKAGKIPGMFAGTVAIARRWVDEGFQFVTVGCDTRLLEGALLATLSDLRAAELA